MRIVIINNLYKPYARGGAERIAEMTAEEFVRQGHEVTVLSTSPRRFKLTASFSVLGKIRLYYFPSSFYYLGQIPAPLRLLWHLWDEVKLGKFLKIFSILRQEKPDLIITHNLKGIGFLTPLAIRLSGVKHIHTLHDIQILHPSGLMYYKQERGIDSFFARAYQALNRLFFASPDIVVSPSAWLLKMHIERGFFKKSQKAVIANPMEAADAKAKMPADGKFSFLFVGQLERHKGVGLLVDAFMNLPQDVLDKSRLDIVGDGSLKEALENKIYSFENIKLLGRKKREELSDLMLQADCIVVPSLCYENSPTVIYEAMSLKVPVLASDLGGIPELLNNDADFLFKPEKEVLTAKMAWAVKNRAELANASRDIRTHINMADAEGYVKKILSSLSS